MHPGQGHSTLYWLRHSFRLLQQRLYLTTFFFQGSHGELPYAVVSIKLIPHHFYDNQAFAVRMQGKGQV